ncbi:MAG: SpoIIE family protein phosphatase [Chloroflexota bacterium]|nr:SpoIIE family protein phosphatase [Chloroflexota bacterium]
MITCPKCGKQNRPTAKFCKYCGTDFSPTRAVNAHATLPAIPAPVPAKDEPTQSETDVLSGLVQTVKRWMGEEPLPSPTPTRPLRDSETPPPQPASPAVTQTMDRLTPLQPGSILSHPQHPRQQYSIVMARELPRSIYYDALDLTCPNCGIPQSDVPLDGLCQPCQTPLQPVLIHERRPRQTSMRRGGEALAKPDIEKLIQLSAGHSNILLHQAIIQYQDSVYTVVEHPGRWGVLVRGRRQRSPDEALAGAAQVGRAMAHLHDHGFTHSEVGGTSIESLIVSGDGTIKLADLSTCVRLEPSDDQTLRAQINSDVAFLGWLLFYLATGQELSRADIELVPPVLRPIVERAMQRQYASVRDMLTDFSLLPSAPPPARSLKPSHGQATHPGQKHTRNEDAVVTFTFDKEQNGRSVPTGFYLVADGMGGHDAGDVASRAVNQIVTDWIINAQVLPDLRKATRKLKAKDMAGEMLAQAIQQANETLVRHGKTKNSDLGSTVTAALVIGNVATIASVGDSRTYLLRGGYLEQITQDHSLVARLVDAGVIGPEDVRSHPQRNQIYRCLGHKPDVEVDTFTRQLQAGDVLVLCSDGLWEMVLDDEIQHIVAAARSPQKACDALVEAANRAGGEDNIAVIVVEVE